MAISITGRVSSPIPIKTPVKLTSESDKSSVKTTDSNDELAITNMAQEIKKGFQSTATSASLDMARIASVKKALSEGSYTIDPERVAKKLIQFEKTLP